MHFSFSFSLLKQHYRGPCPSSQVVVPIGSIIEFNCSYNYTGSFFTFWDISNI